MEYKLFSDIMIIKISSISFKTIDDFLEFYVPSKKMRYLLFQNQWIKIDGNYIRRNQLLVGENLYPFGDGSGDVYLFLQKIKHLSPCFVV